MTDRLFTAARLGAALFCAASLLLAAACGQNDKVPVSYYAVNETDTSIVSIIVNGEGGVLNATANGGGGEMCCVIIPRRWRPGLTATIKWQLDGQWLQDDKGNVVLRNGNKVFVEGPWHEQTVVVPEYGEKQLGRFYIHFRSGNEVKVLVSWVGPTHPDYPLPLTIKIQGH